MRLDDVLDRLGVASAERRREEGDVVFACVDNHATRKLLSDRAEQLRNVVLISGGNDGVEDGLRGTAGNVQIHVRRDGEDLTAPITRFHPEIRDPTDEVPGPSCTDLAATTAPQVVFTNSLGAVDERLCRPDTAGIEGVRQYARGLQEKFNVIFARATPQELLLQASERFQRRLK